MSKNKLDTVGLAKYHKFMWERVLRPYQKEWILSILHGRYSGMLGARQIGKSYAIGYAAILLASGYRDKSVVIQPHDVLIISADQNKAQNIIRSVQSHLDKIGIAVGEIKDDRLGGLQMAVLTNGKRITAVSGRPKSLQGFTGTVLVDELSITDWDPEELFAQALAVSSAEDSFRVCLVSNADREGSFVHRFFFDEGEEWRNRRDDFRLHNTTIWDAYGENLPSRILSVKKAMSDRMWSRFYENQFIAGDDGRFESDLISSCVGNVVKPFDGVRILSIDPGHTINPSGLVIADAGGGRLNVLYSDLWFGVDEEEQIERIGNLMNSYACSKILFDQGTNIGFRQRLEKIWGTRLIPVSVSRNKQNMWADELDKLLNEKRINIRSTDKWLIQDLKSLGLDERMNLVVPERRYKNTHFKIHADAAMALLYMMEYVGVAATVDRPMEVLDVYDPLDATFGDYRDFNL
jgi:hypothetical protein